MTAVSNREAEEPTPRRPQRGSFSEFGYRDTMGRFCARHRLAQFWADARLPALVTGNRGALTHGSDHQPADRVTAAPAAENLSNPVDGLAWDRPGFDVDRPGPVRRPGGTHRPLTAVALDRTLHFDAAGRFIHLCSNCGREAVLSARVNLLAGRLGTWYCGACKGPSSPLNAGRQPEKPRSATSPTVAGTSVETWPPEARMSRWIDGVRSDVEAAPAILAEESAP